MNESRKMGKINGSVMVSHASTKDDLKHEIRGNNLSQELYMSMSKLSSAKLLLPYKFYCKALSKRLFKHRLGIKIHNQHKISCRLNSLTSSDHFKDTVLTVIDIDQDYYSRVDGRPLNIYVPVYKTLKSMLNKSLRTKYNIGVTKDKILKIERNYANEEFIYNQSVAEFTKQAKYFDSFISEDYKKSIFILTQSETLGAKVDHMITELQNKATEKFNLKSKLVGLDYKYSVQQKYGRFLYYLSPPSWRANHREFARSIEIEMKGFDLGHQSDGNVFSVLFEKLRSICFETPVKPVLYFKRPSDLIELFNGMEKQQLHYFTHVNHVSPHAKALKNSISLLKSNIYRDFYPVERLIDRFKDLLEFNERRCEALENKFYRVLYGDFYKNSVTFDILKLQVNLEYCFENIFSEKPSNMHILAMLKAIEKSFLKYSKQLEAIQNKTVRLLSTRFMDSERKKLKQAEFASAELRLFRRLEYKLLRTYGFLSKKVDNQSYSTKKKKTVKFSSTGITENKKCSLNEAEIEYLTLFTEWRENEDPTKYLLNLDLNDA